MLWYTAIFITLLLHVSALLAVLRENEYFSKELMAFDICKMHFLC